MLTAKPYWLVRPESVDAAEGDDAVFECYAEAIPQPEYFWFLNGVPISSEYASSNEIRTKCTGEGSRRDVG